VNNSINNKGRNLIFLISQPRAGSTMMQRILGSHPDIHTTSEPWIMLHPIYALKQSGIETEYSSDLSLKASNAFISQLPGGMLEYNELLRGFYSKLYQRIIETSGKSYFLDKTPRYYFIIKELHQLYPEAKFIFLFRNPLAVLASIISEWTKRDWYRLSDYKFDLIDAPGYLLDGLAALKSSGISLSYEKFLSKPERSLKELSTSLNVKYYPEIINYGNAPDAKWNFGDQHTVNEKKRPDVFHSDKWKDILNDPQVWRIMDGYLKFIGKDRFEKMGYEYDIYIKILNENKPPVDIEKHSLGLWKLLDNTHSFLIENKQLRQQARQLIQKNELIIQDNDKSVEFLTEYLKLKWQKIERELPTNKVAVYGTHEYCKWIFSITKSLSCLNPVAVLTDYSRESLGLWNKASLSPENFNATDVSAVILATECHQKEYSQQCRKLYGKNIRLIDLYENISSGPYKK
jgi:hypothetical protein